MQACAVSITDASGGTEDASWIPTLRETKGFLSGSPLLVRCPGALGLWPSRRLGLSVQMLSFAFFRLSVFRWDLSRESDPASALVCSHLRLTNPLDRSTSSYDETKRRCSCSCATNRSTSTFGIWILLGSLHAIYWTSHDTAGTIRRLSLCWSALEAIATAVPSSRLQRLFSGFRDISRNKTSCNISVATIL